jgi:alpha-methylacyl-CoA racemase
MGPLSGIRIVEFGGIGPGPFAAMMLADHGAEVIRIERPGASFGPHALARNRKAIGVEFKAPEGVEIARALCRGANGIIEGFRPGVMERLGLGPEMLLADNPRLVYGRMTGWGQDGPLAQAPGHDINYIAVAGMLDGIGAPGGPPVAPVNYVGDFGGGGMLLAFGMVSALLGVKMGAPGQVVDAAMTEGAALLASMSWGFKAAGMWQDGPGANLLSGAAPFYRTYACADGKHAAVGAIEPQFYAALVAGLGEGGVTGGASGLGEATARALAAKGVKVAIFDMNENRREGRGRDRRRVLQGQRHQRRRCRRRLRQGPRRPRPGAGAGQLRRHRQRAKTAGRDKATGEIKHFPLDAFDRIIQINLVGTFRCIAKSAKPACWTWSRWKTASAARSSTPPASRPRTARSARRPIRRRRAAWSA